VKSLYSWQEQVLSHIEPPPRWKRAETHIIEEYDLIEDHASWHDARTEDDELIEIKSCACEYEDGSVGEFAVWEYQWVKLVTRGKFALLVYIPDTDCTVLATKMVFPGQIGKAGTVSKRRHPTMGCRRLRRVAWPEVISLDEIEPRKRHYFTEYYSSEEIEKTAFWYPPEE